jgi:BirA family biotin operon repressor/biotin-[acetyl-CoA-carboxylase] ligase
VTAWRLRVHQSLPSTSDTCIREAQSGEPEGLAVLALEQSAGRGSRGRSWLSPAGGLYLSVLLRPTEPAGLAGLWSLLAAVALREALADPEITLKWPNDLMLGAGKLAGILLDSSGAGPRLEWLVIGFGANLAVAPEITGRTTASLGPTGPEAVARALFARLDHWRGVGLSAARDAWLSATCPIGTPIRLSRPNIAGAFVGLSDDGALQLRAADGIISIASGEIATQRAPNGAA